MLVALQVFEKATKGMPVRLIVTNAADAIELLAQALPSAPLPTARARALMCANAKRAFGLPAVGRRQPPSQGGGFLPTSLLLVCVYTYGRAASARERATARLPCRRASSLISSLLTSIRRFVRTESVVARA